MNVKVLASLGASLHLFASLSHTALPTLVTPSIFWRRRRRRWRKTSKILQDCVPDDSENTILQHPILTRLRASSSSSGAQSSKALLRGFILLSFMVPNLLVSAFLFPGQNPTLRGSTWGSPSHTLSHVFRPQLSRTVRHRILKILLISTPRTQFVREGDSFDCKALIFLLLCPCLSCFFFDKLSLHLDNTGEYSPLPWHSIAFSSNACRRIGVGVHRFCYVLRNGYIFASFSSVYLFSLAKTSLL